MCLDSKIKCFSDWMGFTYTSGEGMAIALCGFWAVAKNPIKKRGTNKMAEVFMVGFVSEIDQNNSIFSCRYITGKYTFTDFTIWDRVCL